MTKTDVTSKKKAVRKGPGNSTRDRYTAVLEDLRSQFQVFGEGLVGVHEKLNEHGERLDSIENKLDNHGRRLESIENKMIAVESDLVFVKEQLSIIRHNQVTRDEFHLLETRVARLERARQS